MRRYLIVLFILLISLSCSDQALAVQKGKMIIILLDQLSLREISSFGSNQLIEFFDDGAQALMNVRTDQGIGSNFTYQALGAGSRGKKYGAVPGILGETLGEFGQKTALFGNTDYQTVAGREARLVLMDRQGQLQSAEQSKKILKADERFPGGWRTNYQKLGELFLDAYDKSDVIVLEVGDFSRIKQATKSGDIQLEGQERLVLETLQRATALINLVKTKVSSHDQLMLIAPTPDQTSEYASKLSWILLAQPGLSGVLTTPTTRRPGLVTISDLAPTILNFFQIPIPTVITGRPLTTTQRMHGGLSHLLQFQQQIQRTSQWRVWFVKGFILVQIAILVLAMFTFFVRKYISQTWWQVIVKLVFGVQLIPLLFLTFAPQMIPDIKLYLAFACGILVINTWIVQQAFKAPFAQIVFLTVLTAAAIIFDIWRQAPAMSNSLLGYCPIIGARFYGIGNEFMGFLIGGTLVGWTGLLDLSTWLEQKKLILTPLVFLGVTTMIGYPTLGANFGGMLTALVAFTFSYLLMHKKGTRKKILGGSLILIIFFLSIIILSDTYSWTGDRSHLGQTVQLVKEQGISALGAIISRKLSMNLKLLRWTIWTRVLLTFIIVLTVLFKRPKGYLHALTKEFPNVTSGFLGVIFGSIVTMIVNDSGVVAAATLLFFAVYPLIYLFLKESELSSLEKKKI